MVSSAVSTCVSVEVRRPKAIASVGTWACWRWVELRMLLGRKMAEVEILYIMSIVGGWCSSCCLNIIELFILLWTNTKLCTWLWVLQSRCYTLDSRGMEIMCILCSVLRHLTDLQCLARSGSFFWGDQMHSTKLTRPRVRGLLIYLYLPPKKAKSPKETWYEENALSGCSSTTASSDRQIS